MRTCDPAVFGMNWYLIVVKILLLSYQPMNLEELILMPGPIVEEMETFFRY